MEAPHTPPALTAHPPHAEALHNEVHSLYNSQSPLLVDPDNLIFTDGSVVTARQTDGADQDEELPKQKASMGPDRLPASRQLVGAGLFIHVCQRAEPCGVA